LKNSERIFVKKKKKTIEYLILRLKIIFEIFLIFLFQINFFNDVLMLKINF
jgi:hypothetical protein